MPVPTKGLTAGGGGRGGLVGETVFDLEGGGLGGLAVNLLDLGGEGRERIEIGGDVVFDLDGGDCWRGIGGFELRGMRPIPADGGGGRGGEPRGFRGI